MRGMSSKRESAAAQHEKRRVRPMLGMCSVLYNRLGALHVSAVLLHRGSDSAGAATAAAWWRWLTGSCSSSFFGSGST